MFKCRQCGRTLGANTPRRCPSCGAEHDRTSRGLWAVVVLDNLFAVLLIAAVVVVTVILMRVLG